jgi:cytochrome c nitrite reductase small subunit
MTAPAEPAQPPRKGARLTLAGVILAVILGAFAGAGIYTLDYAEGTSYLSSDPRACVNCHIMRDEFDAWQKGSHHAAATCNDCHVPHDFFGKYYTKAEHGYRHSKGFTFQDFHEPIQIKESSQAVVAQNCLRCHEAFVRDITAAHADPVGAANCLGCHAHVGHGR